MAELVYAPDLKSGLARGVGSTPTASTWRAHERKGIVLYVCNYSRLVLLDWSGSGARVGVKWVNDKDVTAIVWLLAIIATLEFVQSVGDVLDRIIRSSGGL